MNPHLAGKPIRSGPYTPGRTDLDQMPDTPTQRAHHRRALSETFFRFADLDDVVSDMNIDPLPPTILPNEAAQPVQLGRAQETRPPAHLRSLSVDADFFEGLALDGPLGAEACPNPSPRPRHMRANSMDGYSSTTSAEIDSGKKAMAADRLSELALIDPKRAKRVLANRQSAARSKERKVHYTGELERKVQTLQTEATTLSAKITLLQRDATGLTNENKELKFKLQALEQQAHLRDALNNTLRDELQRLKIAAGQIPATNGNNRGLSSRFSSLPPTFNYFGNHLPAQQQQQTRQQPIQIPHSSVPSNTRLSGRSQPNFQDFNHRA